MQCDYHGESNESFARRIKGIGMAIEGKEVFEKETNQV
jgi:hypothetical protein